MSEKAYARDNVVKIINSVLDKVHQGEPSKDVLLQELLDLRRIINQAREEISSPSDDYLSDATDELDAIVEHTAESTHTIMDACEAIQNSIDGLEGEVAESIEDAMTKIFEACTFQDITGQRINKVVSTLKAVESKVGKILNLLGPQSGESISSGSEESDGDGSGGDGLLNGPQLPGQGISQADIDKLLSEFD